MLPSSGLSLAWQEVRGLKYVKGRTRPERIVNQNQGGGRNIDQAKGWITEVLYLVGQDSSLRHNVQTGSKTRLPLYLMDTGVLYSGVNVVGTLS